MMTGSFQLDRIKELDPLLSAIIIPFLVVAIAVAGMMWTPMVWIVGVGADSAATLTLDCDDGSALTAPGLAPKFDIVVTNRADMAADISLVAEVVDAYGGAEPAADQWSTWLDKGSLELEPGESITVQLSVSSGCGCQDGSTAVTSVNATTTASPGAMASITVTTTLNEDYTPRGVPHIMVDKNAVAVTDESRVRFVLTVTNDGAEETPFDLLFRSLPEGWTGKFDPGSLALEAGEAGEVTVELIVPPENELRNPSVTVACYPTDTTHYYDTAFVQLPTLRPDLRAIAIEPPTELRAGERVTLVGVVKNAGATVANEAPVCVRFFVDGTFIAQRNISALNVGATHRFEVAWEPVAGAEELKIIVDQEMEIAESDESPASNVYTENITVIGGGDEGGSDGAAPTIGMIPTLGALGGIVGLLWAVRRRRELS